MTHSVPRTRSPSNLSFTRSTPCVDGCCGPMLRINSSAPSSVPFFWVASSCTVSATFPCLLPALDAEIFPDPRGVLLENVVILAQRMPLPLVGKQDALEAGMSVKLDAKHVENLAFQPVGGRPDLHQAGGAIIEGHGNLQTQADVVRKRIEDRDEIEALLAARPIHGGEVLEEIEFFFIAAIPRNFGKLGRVNDKVSLLPIFDRILDNRSEARAVTLDQFIVEGNLQ